MTEVSSIYYIFSGPLIEKPTGEISLQGKLGQQDQCFAFHENIVYFYLKGTTTFLNDHIPRFTLAVTMLKAEFTTQIWQLNSIIGQAFHRRFLCTKLHLTLLHTVAVKDLEDGHYYYRERVSPSVMSDSL